MAKARQKAPKAETPEVEPLPTATDEPKKKGKTTAMVVAPVNSKAIQAQAGISALRMVAQAVQNDAVIAKLRKDNLDMLGVSSESGRGKAQVTAAMGIYMAAKIDPSLYTDLPNTWLKIGKDGEKGNKSKVNNLNARLRVALGLEDVHGTKTPEAAQLYGDMATDTPEDAARKESIRTKFAAIIGKAAKVALDALDNGIILSVDKPTGLLVQTDDKKGSGAVKQRFGQSSIVLNEDQNFKVADKKGKVTETKLKALPSFTEILRQAAKDHDVKFETRADMRLSQMSTEKWIIEAATKLATSVGNIKDIEKVSKELREALNKLYDVLDNKLV